MKKEYGLRELVNQYQKEVSYYSQMEAFGVTAYEKNYHQNLISQRTEELIQQIERFVVIAAQQNGPNEEEERFFTLEELSYFDGTEGKPAYVAVNGTVYDLSEKIAWAGGSHFGMQAGRDLTEQFMTCHGGMVTMLEQLPTVGFLINQEEE
jgi:predicted heme/steroid binding protein